MLDTILSIFGIGGEKKPNFAALNPDDVDGYYRASHEIDQAERESPEALKATYARYGLKNEDHWDEVRGAFAMRHKNNPDFAFGAARVGLEVQIKDMAAKSYAFPMNVLDPVDGVTLDRLAYIVASAEATGPSAYAQFGLDPARFERIQSEWSSRMSASADPFSANILSSQYHVYLLQARGVVSRGGAAF